MDAKQLIHNRLINNTLPLGFIWLNEDNTGWVLGMDGPIAIDSRQDLEQTTMEIKSIVRYIKKGGE